MTDLWLRLKVTLSDSEVKYSDPIQCLLFPDIVASSASKYDVLNTPPAKLSVYDYYVLSMRFKEFSHVLAFNDDEQGIILPAQRIYADNKRHIVQVSDIASGNYINNTSYNTQYKCKMKAYNGKYLYWDSSSSAIKLTSNSEQASEFVFCCDWGKIPGTDKDFVAEFKKAIAENMDNSELSVESLGVRFGMSRVQLYRKVKNLTNYTPVEIIRITRLKKAQQLLASTDLTVAEITYQVGFTSPSYFTKCYKEYFGENPNDTRSRKK